jgi:hypothetical protein
MYVLAISAEFRPAKYRRRFVELIIAGKGRLLRQRLHPLLGSLGSKAGLSGLFTGQY